MKNCNQCGKCCTKYSDGGLSVTSEEVDFWEVFRPEIYRYISDEKIWMDPTTGKQLTRCPWLQKIPDQEKYSCAIYYDRPDDCKLYPVTIEQMVDDDCEMIELIDLENPKRAQQALDKLMALDGY